MLLIIINVVPTFIVIFFLIRQIQFSNFIFKDNKTISKKVIVLKPDQILYIFVKFGTPRTYIFRIVWRKFIIIIIS